MRERLAAARHAEQRLLREPVLEPVDELRDRLRLIARGREIRRRVVAVDRSWDERRRLALQVMHLKIAAPAQEKDPRLTIELAQRLRRIRPSATVSITARAQRLREQGRDIIVLSVGEPDFPTPEHIKAAAARRARAQRHEVHARRRLAAPQGGHRHEARARQRPALLAGAGARLDGREAVLLQRVPRPARPRRRGDRRRAVLGVVSRHGAARGRGARDRRDERRARLQDHGRAARGRADAEDAALDLEQPVQSDRRRLLGRGAARARRGVARSSARRRAQRRDLRAHPVDGPRARVLRGRVPGPLRPDADRQRHVEGLRHERLANRLRGRARCPSSRP